MRKENVGIFFLNFPKQVVKKTKVLNNLNTYKIYLCVQTTKRYSYIINDH